MQVKLGSLLDAVDMIHSGRLFLQQECCRHVLLHPSFSHLQALLDTACSSCAAALLHSCSMGYTTNHCLYTGHQQCSCCVGSSHALESCPWCRLNAYSTA